MNSKLTLCLLSIALIQAQGAFGASYYVSTNGSDANPGTSSLPWKTIQYAASTAVAGDTVTVGPGEFNEFVVTKHSGAAGSPITFTGTRGGSGEWLTIIDPSTDASSGWVPAPEVAAGVYKQTFPFVVREMTYNNKRCSYAWTSTNMLSDIYATYPTLGFTNGTDMLTLTNNVMVDLYAGPSPAPMPVNFWDTVGGIFYVPQQATKVCFVKLRDGSNPNGSAIRVAPNLDGSWSILPKAGAWQINGFNYITLRNFAIRGAFADVMLSYSGAHHNLIESNYLYSSSTQLYMDNGAHDNTVRFNKMELNWAGGDISPSGAYDIAGVEQPATNLQRNNYRLSKYMMGDTSQIDNSVFLYFTGTNNVITGNQFGPGMGNGVVVWGIAGSVITNAIISSNIIQNYSSCGIFLGPYCNSTTIFGNMIGNAQANIRFGSVNQAGDTNRSAYVYRNRFWEPAYLGQHIYFQIDNGNPIPPATTYENPNLWIYNNSFTAGAAVMDASFYFSANGGCPGVRFLNNISSGSYFWMFETGSYNVASYFGAYDYNLGAKASIGVLPAWYGTHNLTNATVAWPTNSVPNFVLSAGSQAIDAALDVTQTFSLNGKSFPALPADSTPRVSAGWDMGVLEYGSTIELLAPPLNLQVHLAP